MFTLDELCVRLREVMPSTVTVERTQSFCTNQDTGEDEQHDCVRAIHKNYKDLDPEDVAYIDTLFVDDEVVILVWTLSAEEPTVVTKPRDQAPLDQLLVILKAGFSEPS